MNLCRQIRHNGTSCKSPALRGENLCFFHRRLHEEAGSEESYLSDGETPGTLRLPFLDDLSSVQNALCRVLQAIAAQQISTKHAGLLLYGLQIAQSTMIAAGKKPSRPEDYVTESHTLEAFAVPELSQPTEQQPVPETPEAPALQSVPPPVPPIATMHAVAGTSAYPAPPGPSSTQETGFHRQLHASSLSLAAISRSSAEKHTAHLPGAHFADDQPSVNSLRAERGKGTLVRPETGRDSRELALSSKAGPRSATFPHRFTGAS